MLYISINLLIIGMCLRLNVTSTIVWVVQSLFFNSISFNKPLNNWNVSNDVTSMHDMFLGAIFFNQPIGTYLRYGIIRVASRDHGVRRAGAPPFS